MASFTSSKISFAGSVERVAPLYSTNIKFDHRRAPWPCPPRRLYYRDRRGKSARIAEVTNYKPKADAKALRRRAMKADIHPDYHMIQVKMTKRHHLWRPFDYGARKATPSLDIDPTSHSAGPGVRPKRWIPAAACREVQEQMYWRRLLGYASRRQMETPPPRGRRFFFCVCRKVRRAGP